MVDKNILIPYDLYLKKMVSEKKESVPTQQRLSEDLILKTIPVRFKRKAETLLSYIGSEITWNLSGNVILHGKAIEGSHISDLVKYVLIKFGSKPPIGYEDFYDCLRSSNVPASLINNKPVFNHRQTTIPKEASSITKEWINL